MAYQPKVLAHFRGATVDAFARLRASLPDTVFDSKQLEDNAPLLWSQKLYAGGSSTHSTVEARSRLATVASGDAAIRQTFMRFNYQPGKSQLVLMSFASGHAETNVRKRLGLFETSDAANSTPVNGIYFEAGASITLNIAKNSSVAQSVAQDDWNVDPLDGSGSSGITLDFSKAQILAIDFEWLGVGRVRVGFVVDGVLYYAHEFLNANSLSAVYMSTPNLPLGFSIYQSGVGTGALDAICATVISEGGEEVLGISTPIHNGSTPVVCTTAGTTYALKGVRLKTTHLGRSVFLHDVSALSQTADSFLLRVFLNPTVASVFTYADVTNSGLQEATGVTANTVTGGRELFAGYVSNQSRQLALSPRTLPRLGAAIDGTRDTLVLCATGLTSAAQVAGAMNFVEEA